MAGNANITVPDAIREPGWAFGQPEVPGDYEWWSERHSLDVSRTTIYRGYDGNPASWGRDVWYRRLPDVEGASLPTPWQRSNDQNEIW